MSIDKSWFSAKGKLIQKLRKQKFPNDTQAIFAARVGVGVNTIQKLEAGKEGVAWSTVIRVLELLGKGKVLEELFAEDVYKSNIRSSVTSW